MSFLVQQSVVKQLLFKGNDVWSVDVPDLGEHRH